MAPRSYVLLATRPLYVLDLLAATSTQLSDPRQLQVAANRFRSVAEGSSEAKPRRPSCASTCGKLQAHWLVKEQLRALLATYFTAARPILFRYRTTVGPTLPSPRHLR